jgi:hypothetical protein
VAYAEASTEQRNVAFDTCVLKPNDALAELETLPEAGPEVIVTGEVRVLAVCAFFLQTCRGL